MLGLLAIAAAALLLTGCADVGFPAVHDMPAARADAPLTPDQIKEATDNLICERNHLSTEVQANGAAGAAANAPGRGAPSACADSATAGPAVTGSTLTPSAYAKP